MASKLSTALGSSSDDAPARSPISAYKIEIKDDDNGVPVFRLLAKRSDGTGSKFGNLLVWLDHPHAARALRAALPSIAKALDVIDEMQVKQGTWPAKAATPAAKAAPAAETKKSSLSAALDDLPSFD